jgi:hypothetical protein
MSATAADLRPTEGTPAAIMGAIAVVETEVRTASQRLDDLQASRRVALLNRDDKRVAEFETAARDCELTIERLGLLRAELDGRLGAARVQAERERVDDLLARALGALEEFQSAVSKYPDLARKIVTICEAGRTARHAIRLAQKAAATHGETLVFDWPVFNGRELADVVVLPAEKGMHWGVLPKLEQAIRY